MTMRLFHWNRTQIVKGFHLRQRDNGFEPSRSGSALERTQCECGFPLVQQSRRHIPAK